MENSDAAVDQLELEELVDVEHDAGHDAEHVDDVEDGDGDEDGGEEAAQVAVLPVLDDHDEEEEVEDEGEDGEDGPTSPPPVPLWLDHLQLLGNIQTCNANTSWYKARNLNRQGLPIKTGSPYWKDIKQR